MNRTIVYILLMICVTKSSFAVETGVSFVTTAMVDGFFIGVTDQYGHTNTTPEDPLCFTIGTTNRIWVTNSFITVAFPTQPEYAYKVELFDPTGSRMPKTEKGNTIGIRFDEFDTRPSLKGIRIQRTTTVKDETVPELIHLFRPSDFFTVTNPGTYNLQIRFQILAFPRTGPNRGDYTNDLIHFPPLNYSLVKP